jgi:hypothetical protein
VNKELVLYLILFLFTTTRAVGQIMSTLVFPIFPWVFQVIVIGYFIAVAVYLASAGKASFKVVGPNNATVHCSCHLVIVSVNVSSSVYFVHSNFVYFLAGFQRNMQPDRFQRDLRQGMPRRNLPALRKRRQSLHDLSSTV